MPGGSAAHFERQGFTFDVGSSMMFGFGERGTTNLMTRALAAVGKRLPTVPDPTQIHYHLPPSPRHPDVSPPPHTHTPAALQCVLVQSASFQPNCSGICCITPSHSRLPPCLLPA